MFDQDFLQDSTNTDKSAATDVSAETSSSTDTNTPPSAPADAPAPEKAEVPSAGDKADEEDGSIDDKGKPTMFGLVKKVLGVDKKDAAKKPPSTDNEQKASNDSAGQADSEAAASGQDNKGDDVPKEIADHPAYRQLKEQHEVAMGQASRFVALTNFMQANEIPPAEVQNAFNLLALQRRDPEKFYAELQAMTDEIGIMLGKGRLPSDLQKEVDDGLISEERARETAKLRVTNKHVQSAAEAANQRLSARETTEVAAARARTVETFFAVKGKTDLQLAKKAPFIMREILHLKATEGHPADARGEAALLEKAYENVNKQLNAYAPAKKPVAAPPRSNAAPGRTTEVNDKPPTRFDLVAGVFDRLQSQ